MTTMDKEQFAVDLVKLIEAVLPGDDPAFVFFTYAMDLGGPEIIEKILIAASEKIVWKPLDDRFPFGTPEEEEAGYKAMARVMPLEILQTMQTELLQHEAEKAAKA